ncbi:SH3 domain-containing protein [Ornithinibacillus sp. L9]|uniref:SH3 domain-containing protein n=1 Tax=Ornithinibacillus caprae TaxID=2678566 RepID=A0A6N8FEF1_9BACI|nr:glycosyl hydrolase family 18 protein [Ornithinibacillus caprae]MUK87571.1 SH3 domain-containing protein [Ornithinibacillus caprae]
MRKMFKVFLSLLLVYSFLPNYNQNVSASSSNFNMSYIYFGSTDTFIRNVDKTNGSLNVVSPSYFDLNSDGTLKLTYQLDSKFINEMHNRGIKVVPFLSNHWNRTIGRVALQNREQLSTQIADSIKQYNLDGVNVDIENVTEVDKDAYTDFVRLLREKIPLDKEVSVAVAANPNNWTKGWHGSYDYVKLAKYADYLMVMAYDESYEWGPVGPVASFPWVEKTVQAILKHAPPEKIVLGVPFFGRYWVDGQPHGGIGISNNRIDEIVTRYNGTVTMDQISQSAVAKFTIKESDPKTVVGNRTLAPGNYTIWYENATSLKYKVGLIHKYNLKGMGSWSLGQEQAGIWSELNQALNGGIVSAPNPITTPLQEIIEEKPVQETKPVPIKPTAVKKPVLKKVKTSYNKKNHTVKFTYHVNQPSKITIKVANSSGKVVSTLRNNVNTKSGTHSIQWNASKFKNGNYKFNISAVNSNKQQTKLTQSYKLTKTVANTFKAKNGKVRASVLNVRQQNTTKSKVIGTVKKNQKIKIIGQQGSWYKIEYGKKTGYVSSKYVTK